MSQTERWPECPQVVDRLFVYGTLRSAGENRFQRQLAAGAELEGPATLTGQLYLIDWYPGVVAAQAREDRVVGESWILREAGREDLLAALDDYEGYDPRDRAASLFVRESVGVRIRSSGSQGERCELAWVYWFNRSVDGLERIASGDFFAP